MGSNGLEGLTDVEVQDKLKIYENSELTEHYASCSGCALCEYLTEFFSGCSNCNMVGMLDSGDGDWHMKDGNLFCSGNCMSEFLGGEVSRE